ncbi:hypothetical protein [Dongia sp.]|uniref:hypothetical protein n=1 Tax=Dongia sp. TaxID=1977262 RepID=UPI00374FFF69
MRLMRTVAAALALSALTATAAFAEGKEVDCSETKLSFKAPGFEVKCKDYSRSSVSTGQSVAASNSYSLYAYSQKDVTFLDAFSDYIVSASVYYTRRSMEADLESNYTAKFSDWATQEDVGDYEIRTVTVTFSDGEPLECVGFRKLGARRWEGINGLTVGLSCSDGGRDKAFETVKLFISQD